MIYNLNERHFSIKKGGFQITPISVFPMAPEQFAHDSEFQAML